MSDSQYNELYDILGLPSKRQRPVSDYWDRGLSQDERAKTYILDKVEEMKIQKQAIKQKWQKEHHEWFQANSEACVHYKTKYKEFYDRARAKAVAKLQQEHTPKEYYAARVKRFTDKIFQEDNRFFLSQYARFFNTEPKKPVYYYHLKAEIDRIIKENPEVFN